MGNSRRQFKDGEASCCICNDPLPPFVSNSRARYVCVNPGCHAKYRELYVYPRTRISVAEREIVCSRPGCGKFLPPGLYSKSTTRLFCSPYCDHLFYARRHVVGNCIQCGKPILGMPHERGKRKYDTEECRVLYHKETRVREKAGPLAHDLEMYFEREGKLRYGPRTYPTMRSSLIKYSSYLVGRGITRFADVTPRLITDYTNFQRSNGMQSDNYISRINVLHSWVQAFIDPTAQNPVIPHIHIARRRELNPRPYSEAQMEYLWECLFRDDLLQLKLAFAIGEESGLRISEVTNLRLGDVDLAAQKLFVRLPTKNGKTRTVPFHDKVVQYLNLWLAVRDPRCTYDHLLHNTKLRPYCQTTLSQVFYKRFGRLTDGRVDFSFHALRHTWCSRLLNAGIEPAVLMELGGWKSWASMQHYTKLLRSTVERSYETAWSNRRQQLEAEPEITMSLVEFAESQNEAEAA